MLAGMLQGQKWQQASWTPSGAPLSSEVEALIQKAPEGARRALRGLPGKQAEELKAGHVSFAAASLAGCHEEGQD